MTVHSRPRHPALAATLSFLFPGLGQAYAGQRELALVLAAPILLLLIGAGVAVVLLGDELRNRLFSSSFLLSLLVLDLALLAWRLFAIAQAGLGRRGLRRTSARVIAIVALLAVLTVAMHAYAGLVISSLENALDRVFSGGSVAQPVGGVVAPPVPVNEPEYRWDGTERINFLLLGVDAAPDRRQSLTDTILVVSVDPVRREAVLISIPRDTGFMPLPDTRIYADGLYPHKINQLSTDAQAAPERWCPDLDDARNCGIRTLQRSVGLYLGIDIHHYAQVDFTGFARIIDAVGGVELCLPGRLSDPDYVDARTGERGLALDGGCLLRDGSAALAFARIRSGVIVMPDGTMDPQDDFKRADRQQQVLLAMREEIAAGNTFLELPSVLDAIGATVSTDFPRDRGGDLASLLPLITGPDIERVVLGLPEYVDPPVNPQVNYLLIPKRAAIQDEAERLFGDDLQGWYVGSDASTPDAHDGGAEPNETPAGP